MSRLGKFGPIAGILALGAVPLGGGEARADGLQSTVPATCGAENLIAGKRPSQWQDIRGDMGLVTDGAVAPEGAQWDAPVAMILETGAGTITYDLGRVYPVSAIFLQADANDSYKVMGSVDGSPNSFKLIVEIDSVSERGHGLRGRAVQVKPMDARFVKVGEGLGDSLFSIAEFSVYCQAPTPFPPTMKTADAPAARVIEPPWYKLAWWEDKVSARLELTLALVGMALLLWGWWVKRSQQETPLPNWVPSAVAATSFGIYITTTALTVVGTNWLPSPVPVAFCVFSCLCTLLVTPGRGRSTLVALWRRRKKPRGAEDAAAAAKPAGKERGRERVRRPPSAAIVRNQILVLVGVLSFQAYWNFGSFHFGNYVHYWDSYHYYVGSKYFKELAYDRLYDCATVADAEDPRLRRRAELRKIMNLRTNFLGGTAEVLAHPEQCKARFTPQRWESFKKDIEFFRNHHGVKRWEEAQTDHGYNATPVWNIAGTLLANLAPASDAQIKFLTVLDPAFVIGMLLMIWWAFGWRTLCVALAVFGTNFPSRFYWTGGAYLRWDWLFYMTAGVCLIKKEKNAVGGFFLAYSGLLRVFPIFLLMGPVFCVIQQILDQTKGRRWWQRLPRREELPLVLKRVDRRYLAVIGGAVLAVATLVPLSLVVSGGSQTYALFLKNSKKHTSTPLTNYMGWRTIMSYKETEASYHLRSDKLEDPWADWKNARLRTYEKRQWLFWAGVLAFVALLYWAVRGFAPWEAAALSSLLIFVIPELTCYYYSFLIVLALLFYKRQEAGIAMLAVTAATGIIDVAPTQFLINSAPWRYLKVMPTTLAEQYTWMSWATMLGIGWLLYDFGWLTRRQAEAAAAASAGAAAEPPAGGPGGEAAAADGGDGASGAPVRRRKRKRRR